MTPLLLSQTKQNMDHSTSYSTYQIDIIHGLQPKTLPFMLVLSYGKYRDIEIHGIDNSVEEKRDLMSNAVQ